MTGRTYAYSASSELSEAAYIRGIALFTLLEGFFVAFGARLSYNFPPSLVLVLVSFGAALLFIWMFTKSDDATVSGIGVTGMSLALGLMMGPLVKLYDVGVVLEAVVLTGAVMILMSLAGIAFPFLFRGMGTFLFGGLAFLIVVGLGQIFLVALGVHQVNTPAINMTLAWIGVAVFTAFVAYDWTQALEQEYTLNNAIDASGGLILDAVNLFLRILEIVGYFNRD